MKGYPSNSINHFPNSVEFPSKLLIDIEVFFFTKGFKNVIKHVFGGIKTYLK